jgi:hypothetical protein
MPSSIKARIGRLAIDRRHRGRSLGAAPMFDAITCTVRADAAIFASLVSRQCTQSCALSAGGKGVGLIRRLGFRNDQQAAQLIDLNRHAEG